MRLTLTEHTLKHGGQKGSDTEYKHTEELS